MPGKLIDGQVTQNYAPNESRAYCEGMAHRLESAAKGTDPYAGQGSLSDAWNAGFDYVDGQALFTIGRNNDQGCALTGTGPTPI